MKTQSPKVHIVLLIHGLYGNPINLTTLKEELEKTHSGKLNLNNEHDRSERNVDEREPLLDRSSSASSSSSSSNSFSIHNTKKSFDDLELAVLVTKSFTGSHTWDGIDVNAHRAAKELDAEIERLEEEGKEIAFISITGYSLGGLIARYLVGLLHSRSPSFFERYKPASFSTIATPHLGILKYGSTTNTIVHTVGRRLFSRTGRQLYCADKEWGGRNLLDILADPNFIFLQALKRFHRVLVVVNGCHDLTVPYPTGSISLIDPFVDYPKNGVKIQLDEQNSIIESWSISSSSLDEITKDEKDLPVISVKNGKVRPRIPPIFLLIPFPFNYLLAVVFPLLLPFALLYVVVTMIYHSWKSAARTKLHHESQESIPLLRDPVTLVSSDPNPISREPQPLNPAKHLIDRSLAQTPSRSSTPISRSSTPSLYDAPNSDTPEQILINSVPLLLSSAQKTMVKNLNEELPQMERLIGWYPWAYNSHATLIVRDAKRFKFQEEGRGVVKRWAKFVANSPEMSQWHVRSSSNPE